MRAPRYWLATPNQTPKVLHFAEGGGGEGGARGGRAAASAEGGDLPV
jgi:hypothetical protein